VTTGALVAGDSFSGSLTRVAGEDVGSYAIQQGTLALNDNYALSFVGANLSITARAITVTADGKTKTYGGTDPALTYQVTTGALVAGDSFSGSLTRVAGEHVGSYAIQEGCLALSGNYALTFVGANLSITAQAITVTADAKTKTYGDADPSLTYQVTTGSLVSGDAFSGNLTRLAGEDVGSYAIQQGTLALSA
ncbi:MAG TPA: MBG domain-containing protein, partial [Vicinamibacterales bacterium]|nr:MBG domain-containing protein [Vicinamibacterales bacterium]